MQHQQLKKILKEYRPYFPKGMQRFGKRVWKFLELPAAAVLERRSILRAYRVFWPAAEVADYAQFKILGPGPDDVLIRAAFTLISPGTERAQLLGLPSAYKHIPNVVYYPGYSGSGTVIAVGTNVTKFKVGDRVAGRVAHGSPAVVREKFLFRVPDGVPLEEAAFIELGIIVLQGIRKARIKPGESVLVLGQGLIGQMANRLSRLAGGTPVVAAARTKAKAPEALSRWGADRFLVLEELNRSGVGQGFDIVIEATGDPHALSVASKLARVGGRVIGLGTPRRSGSINLGQDDSRAGITIIGAHITGMPQTDESEGLWTYRSEGQLFLDLLAQGKLGLNDLITQCSDPSQANEIYDFLKKGDPRMIGMVFDWTNHTSNKQPSHTTKALDMRQTNSSFQLSKRWSTWKVDLKKEPSMSTLPQEKSLRVGIVGGGDIGLRNANSVRAAPGAMVAAVCDISPEVLWDLAKRFEVPAISEYEALLARSDIDAVLLSLPHVLHAPFAIQAAQAGKHVMLEKPLGVNLHDATRIVDACHQAGVRLTVNFSFRYIPAIELVRELIQNEILGEICGIQINFFLFKGAGYWAAGYTGRASSDWRTSKAAAGGGVLINNVCHAIDYLRFCTGLEVRRVFSEYGTFASPIEVEDTIVLTFQYDNGAIGSANATSAWRAEKLDEVRIWGTHGTLRIQENNKVSLWSTRRWQELAPGKEHHLNKLPQIDYTAKWIQRFALAIANDTPHEITGEDGWINNAVIEAVYNSRDLGQAIEVESPA